MSDDGVESIRIDRLLVYLRLARTRAAARAMIQAQALRRNRKHVRRASELVCIGDVLTVVVGNDVRVVEVTALPARRGSAAFARTFYDELSRSVPAEQLPSNSGLGTRAKEH